MQVSRCATGQVRGSDLETACCARVLAVTYRAMGLLPGGRRPGRHDPGSFWSGDNLGLSAGFWLGGQIAVHLPAGDTGMPRPPGALGPVRFPGLSVAGMPCRPEDVMRHRAGMSWLAGLAVVLAGSLLSAVWPPGAATALLPARAVVMSAMVVSGFASAGQPLTTARWEAR